jgi:hypothetical protein
MSKNIIFALMYHRHELLDLMHTDINASSWIRTHGSSIRASDRATTVIGL